MADWKWGDQFGDDDDENDEEGDIPRWQFGSRDGLIFLIDVSKSMFEKPNEDEDSPFELCIRCAKSVIQNKIISSDKDLLGIVFFGTEKEKGDFKHVFILHDLDQPGAERVLELEALIDEPDNNDFNAKYGHSNAFSLSDAFWTCSNMFSKCSQKIGYKRVMLFTNNDNPHAGDAQMQRQAAAKAMDLHENGINVELMHMNKPSGHLFDLKVFYKDILFPDEDEATAMPDPSDKFDELLNRVRSKDHKKRALTRIPFTLGKGLNFSVGVYNLVRACTKPSAVKLYKKTNEEIRSVTKTFLEDTGEVLMPQDMKKAQVYSSKQIYFEKEEVDEIKKFDSPGLKLMGFKPRSSLKPYFQVRPAQFVYPDDSTIEGSSTPFTALLRKCMEREVVPICRFIARKNSPPRFVALVPQEEEVDEHSVQVTPPGFHVIFLPFADDFRKIKMEENLPRATADQRDKAKEIVKKLQFSFKSESFENPNLQTHYVNVEAIALEKDSPEEVVDYTLPNEEMIKKRAGKIIDEFRDLVYPEGYVPGAKKRPAGGAAGGTAKKAKAEPVDIDVEKEAKAGRLAKLTVPILKEFCKKTRLSPSSQKKADLIDAISDHFGL